MHSLINNDKMMALSISKYPKRFSQKATMGVCLGFGHRGLRLKFHGPQSRSGALGLAPALKVPEVGMVSKGVKVQLDSNHQNNLSIFLRITKIFFPS